jgi:hypothetical protein
MLQLGAAGQMTAPYTRAEVVWRTDRLCLSKVPVACVYERALKVCSFLHITGGLCFFSGALTACAFVVYWQLVLLVVYWWLMLLVAYSRLYFAGVLLVAL